jgi:hypothetical protein
MLLFTMIIHQIIGSTKIIKKKSSDGKNRHPYENDTGQGMSKEPFRVYGRQGPPWVRSRIGVESESIRGYLWGTGDVLTVDWEG